MTINTSAGPSRLRHDGWQVPVRQPAACRATACIIANASQARRCRRHRRTRRAHNTTATPHICVLAGCSLGIAAPSAASSTGGCSHGLGRCATAVISVLGWRSARLKRKRCAAAIASKVTEGSKGHGHRLIDDAGTYAVRARQRRNRETANPSRCTHAGNRSCAAGAAATTNAATVHGTSAAATAGRG